MPTTLTDIQSLDWSPKLGYPGEIVEAHDDIDQCIRIILTTPKGSRAHEPEFGSDHFQYIDAPVQEAIPNIIREIVDAVETWEPRARIVGVTPVLSDDGAQVSMSIEWAVKDEDDTQKMEVTINE